MDARSGNAKLSAETIEGATSFGISATNFVGQLERQFGAYSTSQVLGMGDDFKMIGVHATSIATQVIENKSTGDRSVLSFVLDSVGLLGAPVRVLNHPVPFRGAALPVPASGVIVNDVLNRRQAQVVPSQVANVLTHDDAFLGAGLGSARDGFAATTHTDARRIGRDTQSAVLRESVGTAARAATHSGGVLQGSPAINTRFDRLGMHFDDSSSESWGATPSAVSAARGLIAAQIIAAQEF